jgi:hypothetical protein
MPDIRSLVEPVRTNYARGSNLLLWTTRAGYMVTRRTGYRLSASTQGLRRLSPVRQDHVLLTSTVGLAIEHVFGYHTMEWIADGIRKDNPADPY